MNMIYVRKIRLQSLESLKERVLASHQKTGNEDYPYTFIFKFFFLLYNTVLVLPYINMNPPQVYISSHSWTPLPPPSPYHPSGLSQCTSPKHPVSCIEPKLAIHSLYDIILVSMPFSQIIPPSSSPTESKSLFYTSASLLLSCIQGYRRTFSYVIYKINSPISSSLRRQMLT